MKLLIFDTETTGLPKARLPSSRGPNNWPHIVSISWVILDADTNKTIDVQSYIVKPRNWTVPEDSVKIHGITEEKAQKEGYDLQFVISQFLGQSYDILVAHNLEFDYNVLHNAINWDLDIEFNGISKPKYCTMELSKDICKLKGMFGYKSPKLSELYEYTFKRKPDSHSLHNSLYDTMILRDVIESCDELRRKMNLPTTQQSTTTKDVRPKNDSRILSIRLEVL
jgi:DNA polymerase III epsilon subunit-like protein